jgi:D-alanine-D-alanine ligase
MSPARLHLVVLFGGQSAEHDVSCTTAAHVLRAADPAKYRITAIGIGRDGSWFLAEEAMQALEAGAHTLPGRLTPAGTPIAAGTGVNPVEHEVTVVLPLLHGPLGEDGTVQGLLELLDLPYVGSGVLGSAVSMDKAIAKEVLAGHGIAQARWRSLREDQVGPSTAASLVAELGLPLFVKPANMGSSIGITRATGADELAAAVDVALRYDDLLVIEEALSVRELETAVLGSTNRPRVSVVGEIVPAAEFYDFDDKYTDGAARTVIPADLSEELSRDARDLALRTFTTLRAEGLARVDLFLAEGRGLLVNEVNTLPGFTPISMYPMLWAASGLPYGELLDELVALALERHAARARLR